MKKYLLPILFFFGLLALLVPAQTKASYSYFTDFGSQPSELVYEVWEGGNRTAPLACGTDACATFETQGNKDFMRMAVNPSNNPGFYQNTATSQVDIAAPNPTNSGPYNVSYGHPITMEAKIKWSNNYDLLGLGDAQGTSGITFWNSAFDDPMQGQTGEYDQIGFTWLSKDVLNGVVSGFAATSFVDFLPVGISHPILPINIHEWFKVKMVWSENILGVQTVTYYADDQLLGVHVLPAQLEGMSLEIWNDNQEPYLCPEGGNGGLPICPSFPNPNQQQNFYVDYVKVTQP